MSVPLVLFWITCGVFAGDIVLGKLGVSTGGQVHQYLGDVSHFLLLALASAFLTAECLRRETRRKRGPGGGTAPARGSAAPGKP